MTTPISYALFYIQNDPDIVYGTSGGVNFIGLFSTKENAVQWIIDDYHKDYTKSQYFNYKHDKTKTPTADQLISGLNPKVKVITYPDRFRLIPVKPDQPINLELGSWFYIE